MAFDRRRHGLKRASAGAKMTQSIAIGVLGAILVAILLAGCSDDPSSTPSARTVPSPTITAQPGVTSEPTLAPTSVPTNTSIPTFTPTPAFAPTPTFTPTQTSTPTPAITPTPTPAPAKYSVESVDIGFTGGGQGLVQTSFSVTVKNVGELPATELVKLELLLDDDKREPVSTIDPLAVGETSSIELSRELAPGHHRVTFIVADSEMSVDVHVKAADITLTAVRHVITSDGAIVLEVQVTNQGDLIADSVALSARWVPLAKDTADTDGSSGSAEGAVVTERLSSGENRVVRLPVEIPAGSYAFTLSAETGSIEAFRDNNSAETTVEVDYVKLIVSIESVRHVGYEQDGDGIVVMDFSVANEGVTDSGELIAGVMCVDGGCFQSLALDSLQVGDSVDIMIKVAMPHGTTDTLVFAGGLDEGYRWGEDNVGKVTVNIAERATVSPAQNAETVVVGGYWSDGTANVEVTPSLHSEDIKDITVTCSQRGETASACPQHAIVWPADGIGPSAETLIMRLPMGESYVLTFDYGGNENFVVIHVPERILGVERDVWGCFSDTSNIGTVWEKDLGIGCAGWVVETITKWDQNVPLKLWVNPAGDEKHIEALDKVLARFFPILNLDVQRVSDIRDANFVAHVGATVSEVDAVDVSCHPASGCIGSWPIDDGVIRSGLIVVYPLAWKDDSEMEEAMLEDALYSLVQVRRRHLDQTSVMGHFEAVDPTYLHRTDEALVRLLYHPLVRPGMIMGEVGELVVLRDELLDRPESAPLTPLQMLEEAYARLQAADSVSYSVSGSGAECGPQFTLTNFEVANYHFYGPRWVHLSDGTDHYYVIEHDYNIHYPFTDKSKAEFWDNRSGQWRKFGIGDLNQSEILRRYRELSPHHALITIFRAGDDVEVELVGRTDRELVIIARFDPQSLLYPSAEIVIVLDEQSYEIREYTLRWPNEQCPLLELSAKDGRYGIEFEFPDEIMASSPYLGSCRPETLGPISGTITFEDVLPGSCGIDQTRNMRRYHFTLEAPASVVNIFAIRHYLTHRLLNNEGTPIGAGNIRHGPYTQSSWTGKVLPAGQYTIEVEGLDTLVSDDYKLEITATPFAGSPASISSGYEFTCALDTGGNPYCWGTNHDGRASPPKDERFEFISSGPFHACGLRHDGSAVCWGDGREGTTSPPADGRFMAISSGGWKHVCALEIHGSPTCWGSNRYGETSSPPGQKFAAISSGNFHVCALREEGLPVCWGYGGAGRTSPPTGERFNAIDSGGFHTCALREDGSPICWGGDSDGQASPPEDERFTAISSGERHTCALRTDGSPVCWGNNEYGQSLPPDGEKFTAISSGHGHTSHTCGITHEGAILCWGWGQ